MGQSMEPGQSFELLSFDQVACVRGGRLLFRKVSFALEPGGAMVVSGPNGVGKSSLLRVAAGLLAPLSGRVERSAPVALTDEGLALDLERTLAQALAFWAELDGHSATPAMDAMDLAALADVPVRMLSTGQRKRAALARTIASSAPLWLLDEPANGLDADSVIRLESAIASHRTGGGAVLIASHLPIRVPDAQTLTLAPQTEREDV